MIKALASLAFLVFYVAVSWRMKFHAMSQPSWPPRQAEGGDQLRQQRAGPKGSGRRRAARSVRRTLARELARRLDLPIEYVTFDAAGKVFEAVEAGSWDIAFLAIDPVRSKASPSRRPTW